MRQRRWSSHRVTAVIHCWIGLAVQTNTVMVQAEPRWICAVAPRSLPGFSYAERDPPQELVPVLQCARALRFLTDTEHKGDCRRIIKLKDLAAKGCSWNVYGCSHRSSLGEFAKEGISRGIKPAVEVAWLEVRVAQVPGLGCSWLLYTKDILPQPSTQCLDLAAPAATALLWVTEPPGQGTGFLRCWRAFTGFTLPLLLPLPVAQTSPPPSWGIYLPSCFLGVGFLG